MKFIIIVAGLLCWANFSVIAQQSKSNNKIITDTLSVLGNCKQCKERIEDAAYIKGVKSAIWDKQSKVLTIVYLSAKTNVDKIAISIAQAGHDNRLAKANDKKYKSLPSCCAYRDGFCSHE